MGFSSGLCRRDHNIGPRAGACRGFGTGWWHWPARVPPPL